MPRRSLLLSFRDAFAGIGYVIRTQRNAKIQCAVGVATIVLAGILRVPARDWATLAVAVALVLAAETANTAIEAIVDAISPTHSEMARIAKDTSAGAVLILAIGAVATGLFILGPPLWHLLP